MALSRSEDPNRLTEDEVRRIGAVAEYSGETYEDAKSRALDYLSMGHSLHDALELIRKDARQVVRASVRVSAQEITSYRIPQPVLDVAMDLAQGDISRLRIDPTDGSITVVNTSRKRDS